MTGWFLLVFVAAALLHAAPARADLYDSDDELRQHLLSTDPILSRAGDCRGASIERERADRLARFTLRTTCPAPPPEDDCPSYRVTARGTVDGATQATIRDLRMELVCTDDPERVARIGGSFAGPFDVVTALTLVYGRAPWSGSAAELLVALENRSPDTERLADPASAADDGPFIEPLFDQAFIEDGVERHVVIATLTPRPRSQYSCHACPPVIGGAVFRRDGDVWRLESAGPEIERAHAWFDGVHGDLSLIRIGTQRYALLHRNNDKGGGYESRATSLIFGRDGVLANRFTARIPEGGGTTPGPGACPVPDIGLDVVVVESDPPGDDGLFDLVADATWNEARCVSAQLDDGPGITASGESCRKRTRYRFVDGEYQPAAVEIDACTPIPPRTVSLRG